MASEFSLAGKHALVIGVSNVLGRAAAVALAEAGANVAVTTTTRSQREGVVANSCANEIWALNRKGFAQAIDAADESAVQSAVERAVSELGSLDILVNAPDLPFAKPLPEIAAAEWRRAIDVNLTGVYLACRAAGEVMLAPKPGGPGFNLTGVGRSGRIINIVSLLGERGLANGSAYCAAQAGVLNFTRALALEWARRGVTVNAVGAGWTEGMGIITDESKAQLERYLPYKRLGQPDEIAGAVVYLASGVAEYLTGQVIWIEGGALSHV
jgi:NAD(P)-dependent dehydrogenase (short-subunit alcohol dehydrogenase family)